MPLLSSSESDPEQCISKKKKVLAFTCNEGLSTDCSSSYTASQKYYHEKLDKQVDKLTWLECYSNEDISCAQKADAHVSLFHEWIRDNLHPSNEELKSHASEVRVLMSRRHTLKVQNDVLLEESINKVGRKFLQIVLPLAFRHDVLHSLHDLKVVGHLGK